MKENKKEVIIVTYCPFCRKAHEIPVNEMDWLDWEDGANAQDVFPYLSPAEREMIISGICPDCWDAFDEDDEDEEPSNDFDECGYNPYMGGYDFDC